VPGLPFPKLVEYFITALERHGATVLIAESTRERPVRISVTSAGETTECLLFLWTVTPGGGGPTVRPANERRIQLTNVDSLPMEPGVRTILGGYSEETGVWCFWDARRHRRFSTRSPSLQLSVQTMHEAGEQQIAAQPRESASGTEVVVAVVPDALLWYVQNGAALHDAGTDSGAVAELVIASPEEERDFIDSSETDDQVVRRMDLVETLRAFRDAKFRPAVLKAYSFRCAITGVSLRLIDAAHIVPVAHPRGTDDVTNGIALNRLHHAAYDAGLIGITGDFKLVVNPAAVDRLRAVKLEAGLDEFRKSLPERITLPVLRELWPSRANLRLGLEVRHFPSSMVA